MADIHADWTDSFADAPRENTGDHVHGDMSGKYHALHVLNQTSKILSSASHALSGGGDEAGVILGALAGAAVGVALGIAEHHKQAEASQVESKLGNPPQSTPTQPSTESQQDAAAPQIKQPMEQSM